MAHLNGTKATLLAVLVAIALALSGWALATTVNHAERIARTETIVNGLGQRLDGLAGWLRRIDDKLDRVLERPRP